MTASTSPSPPIEITEMIDVIIPSPGQMASNEGDINENENDEKENERKDELQLQEYITLRFMIAGGNDILSATATAYASLKHHIIKTPHQLKHHIKEEKLVNKWIEKDKMKCIIIQINQVMDIH
eukprot:508001_1